MHPYLATPRRLMLLARVIQGQAHHPQRYMVETLAGILEDVAITLRATPIEDSDQLSPMARDMLQEATDLLTEHDFRVPAAIIGYATAPWTGVLPKLDPLGAVSVQLASQDADLRARRLAVIERGHLNSRDDDVLMAALSCLLDLHRKHERLAAAVAADLASL
jgi:hypothetical protein